MFFRRESPKKISFAGHVEALRQAGFEIKPADGGIEVSRGGCAVMVRDRDSAPRIEHRAGVLLGGEIASLVDGGFQKFFRTPSGTSRPALATDLKALHDFEEDLNEALGLESLYNESLGTVSTFYRYDRLQGR